MPQEGLPVNIEPGDWSIVDVVYGSGPDSSRVESYFVIGEFTDVDGDYEHVCQVRCPMTWGADAHHYDVDKTRDRARLLASAPRLLRALNDLLYELPRKSGGLQARRIAAARDAIEYATGKPWGLNVA